jgi:hypothetical protein
LGGSSEGAPAAGEIKKRVLPAFAKVESRKEGSEGAREEDTQHAGIVPDTAELGIQRGVNHIGSDIKSKSEGQLLEDTKVVGPMLTSVFRSHVGITTLVSPNDDDPLT